MIIQKKMKICAGIVTYNPNVERLKKNIDNIRGQVDTVIVCDNGSDNIEDIKCITDFKEVNLIMLKKNMGIAYALNQLCKYALENSYEWILTLDQDSICPHDLIDILQKRCSNSIAVIGPRIIYEGNEKYSNDYIKEMEEVEWIITSGSLTNIRIWDEIGGFDEKIFIDKVDTDYGIRVNYAGYKVLRDNRVCIRHELGNLQCRRIFGRVVYVTNHKPIRVYYQCRNSIYIYKKLHYGCPLIELVKLLVKIVLFEDNKLAKTRSVKKGIVDALKM